jgi:hypothetical protein
MPVTVYKEGNKKFQKMCRRTLTGWMMAMSLLGLLVLTPCLQASPTINMSDNGLLSHSSFSITQEQAKSLCFVDPELVGIGIELLRPNIASAISSSFQANTVKSLPAVPTAVLMVLIGFLCVSLVRDCRIWLAALSAILWTGQAGIRNVTQLANHLCPTTQASKNFAREAADFYLLKNADRARCDIENTKYIGLLNYLAGIPDSERFSRRLCQPDSTNVITQCKDLFRQSKLLTKNSLLSINLPICRFVPIIEFSVCFKPAFIFQTFPRGPPETAPSQFFVN